MDKNEKIKINLDEVNCLDDILETCDWCDDYFSWQDIIIVGDKHNHFCLCREHYDVYVKAMNS